MSDTVLYKNFRSYFGVMFSEYSGNLRISKNIALMVGYGSDYSFCRAFKRIITSPPVKSRKLF